MAFSEFTESIDVQKAGAPLRRGDAGARTSMGAGAPESDSAVEGLVDSISTSIGADYFRTLGLAVTRGREFTATEELSTSESRVAIIDETLAQQLFGRGDPLGQNVQWQAGRSGSSRTEVARVVGVVAPTRHQLLEHRFRPHIYTPMGQDFRSMMYLHLRTSASSPEAEAAMLQDVRRELMAVDAQVPIIALETRPMFRDRNLILWTLGAGAQIFLAFGALALFMTVVGVYGVKAYVVARRTREIGIRVALGASPRHVIGTIVRDGFLTTAVGLAVGLALSVFAGSLLRNMLFGDARFDATVIFGAMAALAIAAAVAAWLPARRATRIPPTLALRSE
jgi:hypothetical protein